MSLPVARPVASSSRSAIVCIHQPVCLNLPLTNTAFWSDK
jgi:hypothetical protein